jgi:hypothetical protein
VWGFLGPRHEITGVQKLAMEAQSQMFNVDVFDSEGPEQITKQIYLWSLFFL